MGSLKEEAKNYVPPTTLSIADLEEVSIDIDIKNKVVEQGKETEWSYKYFTAKDAEGKEQEYKVPVTVLKQLKAQLESNPDMKTFKVIKEGEGLNTTYTVVVVA